jgi:hypothetical protein
VKPIKFEEGELVLLKVHNFLGKNKKLAETFKGPFVVTKVNDNGTIKMKTKYGQHEQLVNQNQLVKYKQPEEITKPALDIEKEKENTTKRAYNKKLYPGREDGGPVTRSKNSPKENLIKMGGAISICKHMEKLI